MSELPIETAWVKLCPILGIDIPHPLSGTKDSQTREVMEIFEFFKEKSGDGAVSEFVNHFSKLPTLPGIGETKLQQVVNSVRLLKLAESTKKQLEAMGIS